MSDTFDLDGALMRYPLPDGVEDAVISLKNVARLLEKSEPTIKLWLETRGLPYLEAGTNGKAWQFQVSHVWAWYKNFEAERADADRAELEVVEAARLALFPEGEDTNPALGLSSKEMIAEYQAQREWMQTNEFRAQFCNRAEVERVFSDALELVRDQILALPDKMERNAGATPQQVALMIAACDACLKSMHTAFVKSGLAVEDTENGSR